MKESLILGATIVVSIVAAAVIVEKLKGTII